MDLLNLELLASTVIILLIFWAIVGYRHLKRLHKQVDDQWELVYLDLRKRADIIPLLIETVRKYDKGQEELIEKLIELRPRASKLAEPSAEKIEHEHDLSALINMLFEEAQKYEALRTDTTFLEVKKEIDDLEANMQERTRKYNEMVRFYNKHCGMFIWRPVALVFRFEHKNIFEVES